METTKIDTSPDTLTVTFDFSKPQPFGYYARQISEIVEEIERRMYSQGYVVGASEVELLQPSVDNFVTEYWPLGSTCNYVWNKEQILQAELANVEGYKAYILYGEYAWVHAVVIAKDYDEALVTAASADLLGDYKITSEKELEDYAEDDGRGGIEYSGVNMLDCSDHGYDTNWLRFLEVETKELLLNNQPCR